MVHSLTFQKMPTPVVAHNGFLADALKACDADIVGVHIAEEGEGRVSCQLLLEKRIVLRALRCVASLAGEAQVFVHLFVGIGAKIAALAGCKNLVGVIVGVKGTAPAN